MRVLLFRTLCDTGGVSTWMLRLGRDLRARGVTCDFWFCTPSSRLPEFVAAGGTVVACGDAMADRYLAVYERPEQRLTLWRASPRYVASRRRPRHGASAMAGIARQPRALLRSTSNADSTAAATAGRA